MKKIISLVLLTLLLLFGSVSYVKAKDITSLDIPTNLTWKENSYATATWNIVEDANYYLVNVTIYDGEEIVGTNETGTSSNEIDLQQEIYNILVNKNITIFKASFRITAQYIDGNMVVSSDISNESAFKSFELGASIKRLETPINISIDENYIASWTNIEHADFYWIYVYFVNDNDDEQDGAGVVYRQDYFPESSEYIHGTVENGVFKVDIKKILKSIYSFHVTHGWLINGDNVELKIKVNAEEILSNETEYISSEFSNYSNSVSYTSSLEKLDTPTNISIDNNFMASWKDIKEADYYNIYFSSNNPNDGGTQVLRKSFCGESCDGGITENGMFKVNIQESLKNIYYFYIKTGKIKYGDSVETKIRVTANMFNEDSGYIESDVSEWSTVINYLPTFKLLDTPMNVSIDENFIASWTDIPEADYYLISFSLNGGDYHWTAGGSVTRGDQGSSEAYGIVENGVFKADITKTLEEAYEHYYLKYGHIKKGETIELRMKVTAEINITNPIYGEYLGSDYSEFSNTFYYNKDGSTIINKITLSPNEPVVAVGRSIYIGKTIDPITALYSTIKWSTSNDNIVSINNVGKITGVKKGNATITAKINNKEESANVSVYEIESNIDDNESNETVIDTANDIIENVIGEFNTEGTDIENVNEAVNEIETAAHNGHRFHANINRRKRSKSDYNYIAGSIYDKHGDMTIGGGYDVTIEISHRDKNNSDHHIANILEFEKDIKFDMDILDDLPLIPNNKKREYKLMRYHNGKLEDINININGNKINAESNLFSDFVLLYKDVDLPVLTKPKITISKGNGSSLLLKIDEQSLAEKYIIYRSTNNKKWSKLTETTSTTYTNTGLTYGTTYYYKVIAYNSYNGNTGYSNTVSKKVVPNKVENLRVTSVGQKNIKIAWDKVPVTGYEVYMNNKKVATIYKNGTLSYNKTKLSTNRSYSFKVRAYKTVKGKKIYGSFSDTISMKTSPSTPKISLSQKDYASVNVKIKSVGGATKYEIVRSTSKKGTYTKIGEMTTSGTYVDSNLNTGTTYYYKVRACNVNNHCSGYSSISSKKLSLNTPKGISKTVLPFDISFKWSVTPGADGYDIQRSTNKRRGYKSVGTTNETEFTNSKLSSNKTYYYKIRAYRLVNNKKVYSSFTSVIKVKTKKVSTIQKNAINKAKEYLTYEDFSRKVLINNLVDHENLSQSLAEFGANNSGANWNNNALKRGRYVVNEFNFNRSEVIEQLNMEGFTESEINYALNALNM